METANNPVSEADRKSFVSQKLWSRWETRLWTINFFMGTCTLYASRVALPICATAMAQEYGWNKSDSGTVMSCFFWGYAITQILAGGFADRHGGERILSVTTLIWATLTMFTPQLFDFAYWCGSPLFVLLLTRILTGSGPRYAQTLTWVLLLTNILGFHLPSMASIVSRHLTSADKGRVFGICLAGSHFGSVVAGAIGSLLLEWFGWRSLFQFVGFISFIWWYSFKKLKEHTAHRRRHVIAPESFAADALPLMETKEKPLLSAASTTVPWAQLFAHPAFWAASAAQYCGANAYFTMFSWLPSYFSDNFPDAKGVVYNVVPSVAIVITSLIAPFMAGRLMAKGRSTTFTRRVMEGASLLGMAFCLFLVAASSKFYTSLFIFTMAMAARGLHHGGVSVNPHDFAPNHTGSVFGIFNAFSAVTGFVGVYIAGWILQSTGNNWAYVFIFTAAQCIIGSVIYGTLGTGSKII
ncbi:CBN-VNUT-1 protein [Aphelenchoides avenae]|nr:CBN-VNUT-1 protein [Aphelenchus avenae]